MTFIRKVEKSTLESIWKHKRPRIAKAILSKKSNAGLQTILQSHSNKISMVLTQKTDKKASGKRIEDPDMNPTTHIIFLKGTKTYNGDKDSLFNKWCWEK
jgi:hypothetical protein